MNEKAFHTEWIPLQSRFYRIAYYILEDEDEAKDAVQELYLKLWNLRGSLELVKSPAAYGSLLIRNLCIDRLRRRRSTLPLEEDVAAKDPPETELLRKEELRQVLTGMEALPEKQKKLLTLRVMQGLSYARISKMTGLSPLNIRVQVSLARKKLKTLL